MVSLLKSTGPGPIQRHSPIHCNKASILHFHPLQNAKRGPETLTITGIFYDMPALRQNRGFNPDFIFGKNPLFFDKAPLSSYGQ